MSSRQDADAFEEELQEGQVRVQAEEAQRRRVLQRDQGEGRVDDGRQPQAICCSSGQRWSEATTQLMLGTDKQACDLNNLMLYILN